MLCIDPHLRAMTLQNNLLCDKITRLHVAVHPGLVIVYCIFVDYEACMYLKDTCMYLTVIQGGVMKVHPETQSLQSVHSSSKLLHPETCTVVCKNRKRPVIKTACLSPSQIRPILRLNPVEIVLFVFILEICPNRSPLWIPDLRHYLGLVPGSAQPSIQANILFAGCDKC